MILLSVCACSLPTATTTATATATFYRYQSIITRLENASTLRSLVHVSSATSAAHTHTHALLYICICIYVCRTDQVIPVFPPLKFLPLATTERYSRQNANEQARAALVGCCLRRRCRGGFLWRCWWWWFSQRGDFAVAFVALSPNKNSNNEWRKQRWKPTPLPRPASLPALQFYFFILSVFFFRFFRFFAWAPHALPTQLIIQRDF